MRNDWEDAGVARLKRTDVVVRGLKWEPPIPTQNPSALPLSKLSPEGFESLVAEIISRRDNLGVQFYGRSGQKQYGLDVVERERSGTHCLYQVKRHKRITPAKLLSIVDKYAGPPRSGHSQAPRLFDPRRFVVVISASTETDTKIVDAVAAVQTAYAADLEIEVWGAEALGRKLRDAPHLVYAVFGGHWAEAWCGFTPGPKATSAPASLGLIDDPVEVLGLDSAERDAELAEHSSDPPAAAVLYGSIARSLDDNRFPGHAVVMRRRQARALQAGGDRDAAFAVRFDLAVQQALGSEASVYRPEHYELASMESDLTPEQRSKLSLVESIAGWSDVGTNLATAVPALEPLVHERHPHAAVLCCRVIEQSLTDGLFDFLPPRSSVTDVVDSTSELLAQLRDLAAEVETRDVVLRARLRCAIADARMTLDANQLDLAEAYNDLIDEASAGRFRHAQGLVTSRAAYAHAVRGFASRAINLWRQSIMASSEHGYHGDVRLAARSARYVAWDCGDIDPRNWDVLAIVQALPDQTRLLGEHLDPALLAYATAHSKKVVDAFGSARHYLFDARVGGHLQEHQLALKLFGDVLEAAQEPAEAVWCYVAAGEAKKAVSLARTLPSATDVSMWLRSPQRHNRTAAIQVTTAQVRVIRDDDVEPTIEILFENIRGPWKTRHASPTPQIKAVEAVAAFGARIPESAVDRILDIAGPMVAGDLKQPFELCDLLVNTYYAVSSRRDDLCEAITPLLRRAEPPHNLWDLVTMLPAETCGPLLPVITAMAEEGNQFALRALAAWSPEASAVQLLARRVCAVLLRKPHGRERTTTVIGTQEAEAVQLLVHLLNLPAPIEFSPNVCTGHEPVLIGRTYFTRSTISDDAPSSQPTIPPSDVPDEAASIATGPLQDLSVAVAWKLLLLAEDHHDAASSRAKVVTALRRLIPRLPRSTAADLAPRLFALYEGPRLSASDLVEIDSDNPLSRARFPMGADKLAPRALTAAAEAFASGRVPTTAASEAEREFADRISAAAAQLLLDDQLAPLGALTIRAVAGASSTFAHRASSLLLHGNDEVRAIGVGSAQVSAHELKPFVADPSPTVRAAVALRAGELPACLRAMLAEDNDLVVRRRLKSSTSP
ncbi:hypothetical protein [Lentzea sp. NPDC092896]|uniref:hypothetical protein n=1 Tax=Lentzea sp. NPDC092896 TaxID=3364127 RepID=UPI00381C9561